MTHPAGDRRTLPGVVGGGPSEPDPPVPSQADAAEDALRRAVQGVGIADAILHPPE